MNAKSKVYVRSLNLFRLCHLGPNTFYFLKKNTTPFGNYSRSDISFELAVGISCRNDNICRMDGVCLMWHIFSSDHAYRRRFELDWLGRFDCFTSLMHPETLQPRLDHRLLTFVQV
jgi:hypothetical protein